MKQLIVAPHRSNYPNPISFEKGDIVRLGAVDNEYPGWVWTKTRDGHEGWSPLAYLEVTEPHTAVAKQYYCAAELNVKPGEEVEVIDELNGWVWCTNNAGRNGWLPKGVMSDV